MINPDIKLRLLASSNNSHSFLKRLNAPKYKDCKQKLIEKSSYCHFCQQQDTELYIINLDLDYTNNHFSNLALACHFCAYVQHLDLSAQYKHLMQYIIYLPDTSQQKLNRYYHQWQNMIKQKQNIFAIQEAISELSERSELIDKIIGFKTDFKDQLGLLLKPYNKNHSLLSHLRWLPSFELLKLFDPAIIFHS
ncbi:hypothetical protein [Cysteiniphilum halobium]|uniref:hypothetical protein n=1 Tax=Cysteiniphilum halobium TaxID=2219059 RepID=UPI000E65DE8F|nr:hypothetical protein [Cysteiniphilum halobium]